MTSSLSGRPKKIHLSLYLILCVLAGIVSSQGCSKTNPCATGCCSKFGYCGTTEEHCGAGNCVDTCDFKLGCDASNPCKSGCCNTFGFCGLGPDYCAKEVCVTGCDSKSYCDPGGYGEFAEVAHCPLNVCCSKYGFCGLTKEFCGDKKVKRPSCSKDGSMGRVIGYYEGWASRRPCNAFFPEQIPLGIYTHLNFAFATVDPKTFEVLPATNADISLYKRIAGLKRRDPDLKVFIAIGGWTFNDPGPTATTFSDIARSATNQKAFIKSLISFMATYGFDGVDIDWEYPAADDRSGRKEDFDNFPKFMANLKAGLKATGGQDGLSITIPASYWYLQHFDIKKLAKSVDWMNIMTYDLHGTWDKGNKWLGNFLNAHTNLTEITDAMDLLWRNNINPDKVVLGTAFYGRAFTATNPSCLSPGCTFESGANKGPCSREVGILMGSEITDIINEKNLQPVLNKAAAVQVVTFDNNQWVAYDDADTLKMKADFARSQCLGGVMVWAVSHDTKDGTFTKALGKAAGRKVVALAQEEGDGTTTVITQHAQCKWTNCKENCPNGWTRVMRTGYNAREGEFMVDESGCDGIGKHQYCCPPGKQPQCGWYSHYNDGCDPACPEGMTEVGSNSMYCSGNGYQAACCETADISAMTLYNKCSWAEYPLCDLGTCGNTEVALSTTGSGGAECNVRSYDFHTLTIQERKYCCDSSDDNGHWEDCQWYHNLGFGPAGRSWSEDNYCTSGCPADRVRVAMDKYGGGCVGKGARSKCCLPKFQTIEKREDPMDAQYRYALADFLEEPYCDYSPFNSKREVVTGNGSMDAFSIAPRTSKFTYQSVEGLLYLVLYSSPRQNQLDIWSKQVPIKYPNLTIPKIRSWTLVNMIRYSWDEIVHMIVCAMDYYNDKIGGSNTISCVCERLDCCDVDDIECQLAADDDEYDGEATVKRDLVANTTDESNGIKNDSHFGSTQEKGGSQNVLSKRGDKKPYFYAIFGTAITGIITSPAYRSRGAWPAAHRIWEEVFDVNRDEDCNSIRPLTRDLSRGGVRTGYATEHVLERNTLGRFFGDASQGTLQSGIVAQAQRITPEFFVNTLPSPLRIQPPPMTGGEQSNIPNTRMMNALGSMTNERHFVLTRSALNLMKSILMQHKTLISTTTMQARIEANDPDRAFERFRMVIQLMNYMNHPTINEALVNAANDFRAELRRAEEDHNANLSNDRVLAVTYWDEWIRDDMAFASRDVRNFLRDWTARMQRIWGVRTGAQANSVLQLLSQYSDLAWGKDLEIDVSGLDEDDVD